jgi:hypothetical protein
MESARRVEPSGLAVQFERGVRRQHFLAAGHRELTVAVSV